MPGLWPVALAGFLARGGLVLFVAPVVVPPSLVALATFIGPASITPTGPTTGLIVRIALGIGLLVAALLAGVVVGAIAEIALISAGADGRRPGDRLLRRVVLIRLVSLLPVAVVFAIGIQRLGQIVYLELTLPTDLVTPIVIRVAAQAPEIVGAILVAWIFGETWGGLATRLAVLRGDGAGRALAGGLGLFARRIVAVLPLLAGSVLVAVARPRPRDRRDRLVMGLRPRRPPGRAGQRRRRRHGRLDAPVRRVLAGGPGDRRGARHVAGGGLDAGRGGGPSGEWSNGPGACHPVTPEPPEHAVGRSQRYEPCPGSRSPARRAEPWSPAGGSPARPAERWSRR